eukprot:scaffold2989_cov112-Isochrysis_galbana.AAC.2
MGQSGAVSYPATRHAPGLQALRHALSLRWPHGDVHPARPLWEPTAPMYIVTSAYIGVYRYASAVDRHKKIQVLDALVGECDRTLYYPLAD